MAAARSKRWLSNQAKALAETTGLGDPEYAMRKLVAGLLEEAEQKEEPTDLPLVASFRGIVEVCPVPLSGSAMLLPSARGLKILVNSADPPGRRNFSVAHEICHTFFRGCASQPSEADRSIGRFNIGLEEEYLCDIGASALLLPPALVSIRIGDCGHSLDAILDMADKFRSSIEAASIAWAQSASWPCAMVFFEERLKPTQMKKKNQNPFPGMEDMLPRAELRIALARGSSSFPFFLPKDKSVGRNGPIYGCFEGQQRTEGMDTIEIHEEGKSIHSESIFVPYRRDGELVKRVVSLIRPI